MKKYITILCITLGLFILVSCSGSNQDTVQEKQEPVRVVEIEEKIGPVYLEYIGTIQPEEIRRLSFKSSGRIAEIHVEKGHMVKKGDLLVKLDTKDLEFAYEAAQAQANAVRAQYEKALKGASQEEINNAALNLKKARDAYNHANDSYEKAIRLYEEGAISEHEYKSSKLETDIRESELNQAQELYNQVKNGSRDEDIKALSSQLEQASVDTAHKRSLLEDAVLKSDIDGYIVDVTFKENELVSAGIPVVIVRSENETVKVGVSREDIVKLDIGTPAEINVNGIESAGAVSVIQKVPDESTRTYSVDISIESGSFIIGSIADVRFIVGEEKGIWIPLISVIRDEEDYVFILENERAVKKSVELIQVKGNNAMVNGLKDGDLLVVEGMKKLRNGYKAVAVGEGMILE